MHAQHTTPTASSNPQINPQRRLRGTYIWISRVTIHPIMPAQAADAFDVRPVEDRGLAAIALRNLEVDEIVIREQPLLRLTPDGCGRYDGKYYRARDDARNALLTLAQDVGGALGDAADPITKVIETNGIVLDAKSGKCNDKKDPCH